MGRSSPEFDWVCYITWWFRCFLRRESYVSENQIGIPAFAISHYLKSSWLSCLPRIKKLTREGSIGLEAIVSLPAAIRSSAD